ncbi:hypothetical protein CDL12_01870 [Handroanthus impetiginosus]|uniref:Uncharacterized protein n=1 Tax=Handroanthus impetiginosus TaxID=429701 RepID=A0A2G9I6J8_9LAMI|nr:hypothetical protein CDL12_01870 [Handroanthus impetiginosus]
MYAWERALIYKNSLKRHIWFLKFQIEDQRGALPSWFKSWFFSFDPCYDITWILKWSYKVHAKIEKKFSIQSSEPYLLRQNFIRWRNKFDFFDKEAVYAKRRIISQIPPAAIKKELSSPGPSEPSLNDLMAGLSQEEAMKLFSETFGFQIGKDKGKGQLSPFQDSQEIIQVRPL